MKREKILIYGLISMLVLFTVGFLTILRNKFRSTKQNVQQCGRLE